MSFNIAISGLNAVTAQLGTISNNIANSNTAGFKSGRAEFASLYAGGQALGVGVSNITQNMTRRGLLVDGGRSTDLAIQGNGFFVVKDNTGANVYTRAGFFDIDSNGFMVNGQKMRLQGYGADANGNLQTGQIGDIAVGGGALPAKASDSFNLVANLASSKAPIAAGAPPINIADPKTYHHTNTTTVYDSLGGSRTLTQYFVKRADNEWNVYYSVDGSLLQDAAPTPAPIASTLNFDADGKLLTAAPVNQQLTIAGSSGARDLALALNYAGMTQTGKEFSVSRNSANGYEAGQRTGQFIDEDGKIYTTFSNGERMLQGQIVLANFPNPNGLTPLNNNAWRDGAASGAAVIGIPGNGLMGNIAVGKWENSNVNVTEELVELMSAQRNYQANTKVISTNDNMLNALFQVV